VALASVGMAVSTFVGATTAAIAPWLLVPIVAAWGYLTGLAVCLGQRASVAVLQWSIALLIAVGLPFGPAEAGFDLGDRQIPEPFVVGGDDEPRGMRCAALTQRGV
jgi:hypothetical protein